MEIRAIAPNEWKYTYSQSMQITGQTGNIGHLRGDFDSGGYGFYTTWNDHRPQWKTDEFKTELDEVINALRSPEYGLLQNRPAMSEYARRFPDSAFKGNYCTEYGLRVDTEKYAYLLRLNPTKGDYNFYCYCYVKEWLDKHIGNAEKCRFDEQLLIFAQRPDATAVTTLETWNKQFKRWVNKDSRGIAVFDTKGRRNTLKYYFDVSDTHEGYYNSRPVPIWQMNERYEQAVIERLSDRFGDLEGNDLDEALMQTAKNAVEDNLPDYLAQLKECTKDSFLEELDDFNVEVIYKRLAVNSVAFMLMSRCGLDTGEYFETEDFSDIINFNGAYP